MLQLLTVNILPFIAVWLGIKRRESGIIHCLLPKSSIREDVSCCHRLGGFFGGGHCRVNRAREGSGCWQSWLRVEISDITLCVGGLLTHAIVIGM